MAQKHIPDLSVSTENIRALSGLNPARSLFALFMEWLVIALAISLHIYFPNPIVYFLVWVLIGSRMYGLYSLLHDGMHFLLYPNRTVNDWLCRLLMAWPLFLSLEKVRSAHMAHHKYLKTDQDPESVHGHYDEFQFPKTPGSLTLIFLKDLTGFNFLFYKLKKGIRLAGEIKNGTLKMSPEPCRLLFYTIAAGVLIYQGWEIKFLLYWLIPYATIYQALNRLRLSTEHFHIPQEKLLQTRTVKLNPIEQVIFSPHNLGFHAEHHLYPGVPFYRLPELHKILTGTNSFEENVVVNTSYADVIKKYIK